MRSAASRRGGPYTPSQTCHQIGWSIEGRKRASSRMAFDRLRLCRLDRGAEGVDVVSAVLAAAIDEERRGARHSAGAGRVDVIGHPGGADVAAQVLAEPIDV